MRFRLAVLSLAIAASPAHAQSRDSILVVRSRAAIDSVRRQDFPILDAWCKLTSTTKTRKAMCPRLEGRVGRVDSLLAAFWPRTTTTPATPPIVADTAPTPPVVVKPDTTPPVVIVTPGPPPGPVLFTHPFAPPSNGALLAELPRVQVDTTYPTITRRILVTNLQAALDTAKTGDELLLSPGAVYPPLTVKQTARAGWVVIRTDLSDAALGSGRMSVARADSLNLATIKTTSQSSAVWFNQSSGGVRLHGVKIVATYSGTGFNAIVRATNGETTPAQLAHDITLDRVVVDGTTTDLRRNIYADAVRVAVIHSTLENCHATSNTGDSQCYLAANTPGPILIADNTIHGSHQGTMFGGSDPASAQMIPSDIVVAGNLIERPLAWGTQWGEKTLVEQKDAIRVLYERNTVQHVHKAAQAGFAFLIKTENQNCTAPWTQSADVTIRYNVILDAANGINHGANVGACKGVDAARITLYGNVFGPFNGTDAGTCLQYLGALSDMIALHNTCQGAGGSVVTFDGSASLTRAMLSGNVMQHGQYGVKGASTQEGSASLTKFAPGGLFESNVVFPAQCSLYPAGTLCALPSVLPMGSDGKVVGAGGIQ